MKTNILQATPIQQLNESLNNNTFFIKRDDLIPFSFGGNKVRKALLFFKEMERQQCDCVVTYGSSSSNHCRIVANLAASKGLRCIIISPMETNKSTYNSKMMKLFGAEIVNCQVAEVKDTISQKLQELKKDGYKPYFIQGGGHGNIGTKAYVQAYEEIRQYESEKNIHFDYIFHTSGTGTTQAGLICGQKIYGDTRKIVGISNARKNPYGGKVVLTSVNDYLTSIGKDIVTLESIYFIDDYVLGGYGDYNDHVIKTIKEVMTYDGIPLDKTYTGKAYWGMKEYIKDKKIKDKNILFIHTGGTPLFFDDLEEIENE